MTRTIITRQGWNARPPKRRFSPIRPGRMKGIVIHHSGVRNGPNGPAALKAFERQHMDVRLWNAIAYNWLVDEDGTVYEGRGSGIVGGATRGYNSSTESICYTGWGEDKIPNAALDSIAWLIGKIQHDNGNKLFVKSHRDFAATACPGAVLHKWVRDGAQPSGVETEGGESDTVDWEAVRAYVDALGQQVALRPLSRRRRSRGQAVRIVQIHLNRHGHKAGAEDGIFGCKTDRAVRAFQRAQGLKVDGLVGKMTWRALIS